MMEVFIEIDSGVDAEIFAFALKMSLIKDLLLYEAKLKSIYDLERLSKINPLSLEYDKITVFNPYTTRVNAALLSLAFFDALKIGFISQSTNEFIINVIEQYHSLQKHGLEPNQIFMILFTESINQSITSNSGKDYESRILSVLIGLGINKDNIKKVHDHVDKSTEFDLFFELKGKTYGIGAKRTLRERYKQFIKTAQMSPIDVMIEITLGTDLTYDKAVSITNHGIYLFVSDEVYRSNEYMQKMDKIFSCNSLTLAVLEALPASANEKPTEVSS